MGGCPPSARPRHACIAGRPVGRQPSYFVLRGSSSIHRPAHRSMMIDSGLAALARPALHSIACQHMPWLLDGASMKHACARSATNVFVRSFGTLAIHISTGAINRPVCCWLAYVPIRAEQRNARKATSLCYCFRAADCCLGSLLASLLRLRV